MGGGTHSIGKIYIVSEERSKAGCYGYREIWVDTGSKHMQLNLVFCAIKTQLLHQQITHHPSNGWFNAKSLPLEINSVQPSVITW